MPIGLPRSEKSSNALTAPQDGLFVDRRIFISSLTGLIVTDWLYRLNTNETNGRGPIIVEAGRRVDAPDATVARFPPRNVPNVRKRIREVLANQKPSAVASSAACGADLLFLDVANEIHVPRYILLPSDPEVFRASSVTDRPGNWGQLYSKAIRTSNVQVLKVPEGQQGYLETNLKLLDRAQDLAKQHHTSVDALVVWNQESRGQDDVTAHFLEQAKLREIPILEISTIDTNSASFGSALAVVGTINLRI
jgi:hypothetical protein